MKLLVTGGAGFIGSNFIRYILHNNSDINILNLDALKYGSNPANLSDLEKDSRYTFFKGDICDFSIVSQLIKDADTIVNFAAETHVDRSISAPEAFLQSNVIGVFTILEALRKVNPSARMVHISTDEVYGDILKGSFRETDALRPSSPYSASKAASDVFVQGYARTYGLDASITWRSPGPSSRVLAKTTAPWSLWKTGRAMTLDTALIPANYAMNWDGRPGTALSKG